MLDVTLDRKAELGIDCSQVRPANRIHPRRYRTDHVFRLPVRADQTDRRLESVDACGAAMADGDRLQAS